MALPLLLGVAVAGLAVGAISLALWRRRRSRAKLRQMASRLSHAYAPSHGLDDPVADTLPLRHPQGRVAVRWDGLYLHIGRPPEDLRHVPWSSVNNVVPVIGGRFVVEVSKVGLVEISGESGRRLWEAFGARETPTRTFRPERARAVRV